MIIHVPLLEACSAEWVLASTGKLLYWTDREIWHTSSGKQALDNCYWL